MGEELFEIIAHEVTIEVRDENTGEVFRRDLPIDYFENANFLRLSGENLDGSLSQLVFYTPRGIERVKDVSGKGPDHDRCGGHSH
ncbi:MAG: hypothetical protein K5771_07390 [Oscillospiraceae bacterium]|jgi:hypothetical protein|nr:hypothetical protein [Oscillospiraceae bacterium]